MSVKEIKTVLVDHAVSYLRAHSRLIEETWSEKNTTAARNYFYRLTRMKGKRVKIAPPKEMDIPLWARPLVIELSEWLLLHS